MVVGVDFDNTICIDEWPEIGDLIPGALDTLKALQEKGHKLILYTQRTADYPIYCEELKVYKEKHGGTWNTVNLLDPVVNYLRENGLEFYAVNENPDWEQEIQDYGRKVYFDLLIDDHNACIPRVTRFNSLGVPCKTVDWRKLNDWLREEEIL